MRLIPRSTKSARDHADATNHSFFGAMAGFVALDAILVCCLLSPVTGLHAATHNYRLIEQVSAPAFAVERSSVPKPSPIGAPAEPDRAENGRPAPVITATAFANLQK